MQSWWLSSQVLTVKHACCCGQISEDKLNMWYAFHCPSSGDSEPTMKALLTYVKTLRHGLGLETTITFSMKKGQTGRVERAIQTLRRQASTLMEMLQHKCKLNLSSEHRLWQWAYLHAAWLLNRFGAHRAIEAAPFETALGRRYIGKVVCFDEFVMVLDKQPVAKQGPQWLPGVWVGKTSEDDPYKNPNTRRPMRLTPATAMIPPGVPSPGRKAQTSGLETPAVGQGEEPQFFRDKDADDVERYAREHGEDESPTEEAKGEKRGLEGDQEGEPAEKYLRVPPLPLGMDDDDVGERRPVV